MARRESAAKGSLKRVTELHPKNLASTIRFDPELSIRSCLLAYIMCGALAGELVYIPVHIEKLTHQCRFFLIESTRRQAAIRRGLKTVNGIFWG